jgi:2-methylisocitrate lyase-like PEP mutase family enzyme
MAKTESATSAASAFRALHREGEILVLPNAWDAASARLVEACGAAAVATSSAAMSWARGVADGERLGRDALVQTVAEIVRVVRVPVSVDLEAGYAAEPEAIAPTLAAVLEAGAVGINLEDGTAPPEVLAAKIAVARRTAARVGVELFINARTDVYFRNLVPAERALDETLRRARVYREAGCDGVFVPRLVAPEQIRAVAADVRLPLNVLAVPGLAPVAQLQSWGVRRVSAGASLAAAALARVRRATRELLERGEYDAMFDDAVAAREMNELFARAP